MERKIINIRMSLEEKRYAKALSLRLGGCKHDSGSVAYTLKWLLRREADREGVDIGDVYTSSYG